MPFKGIQEYWSMMENFMIVVALSLISRVLIVYYIILHPSMEKVHLNCTEYL